MRSRSTFIAVSVELNEANETLAMRSATFIAVGVELHEGIVVSVELFRTKGGQ
jgi:hypothetical protein